MKRRLFLQAALTGGALGIVAGVDSLKFMQAASADTPKNTFTAESESEVIEALFGKLEVITSDEISLKSPLVASYSQGAKVEVSCSLPDVEMIALVTLNNRYPLNTFVKLDDADAYYSTRIRVEQTSPVTAYVKAGGKLYSSSKIIKVSGVAYGNHVSQFQYSRGGIA